MAGCSTQRSSANACDASFHCRTGGAVLGVRGAVSHGGCSLRSPTRDGYSTGRGYVGLSCTNRICFVRTNDSALP